MHLKLISYTWRIFNKRAQPSSSSSSVLLMLNRASRRALHSTATTLQWGELPRSVPCVMHSKKSFLFMIARVLPMRGVMAEVKTELLCTKKVMPAPTTRARQPASQVNGKGKSTGQHRRGSLKKHCYHCCKSCNVLTTIFLLPVFTTLLMTLATWPFSRELSSLTSSIRQLHSTNREQARRTRPMARSDREQSTKRCLPGVETDRRFREDLM